MPSNIAIRDLDAISDLKSAIDLEKEVWDFDDADVTPLTLAVATRAAGSIWIGAFDGSELIGFAFAFPSLHGGATGRLQFHSHTLATKTARRGTGVGRQLKMAQRQRALALGVTKMTWTFDPLRSRNAHLNFHRLGVICDRYKVDFYGSETSSPLHSNSTDRMWVTWQMADERVESRLKGKDVRAEVLDALALIDPLVRFNGDGRPFEADVSDALARQRVAIEIPGEIDTIESHDKTLAHDWRMATRHAFKAALDAGFVVKEFCRSIRGQQGPGAYLLERSE